jgi:hypothetical protein
MPELSEHELYLLRCVLESWLDEHDYYRHADYSSKAAYAEYEQLARKLGWKPRSEGF